MREIVYSTVKLKPEQRKMIEAYAEVYEAGEHGPEPKLENVNILICGPVTTVELNAMKNLRFIQCVYAGVDALPWGKIPANVVVASNAGSNADSVAEHAFALLLAAAKRILFFDSRVRDGDFEIVGESRMLHGRRLCVLGMGAIGSRIAEIAKAFKMHVVGYGRSLRSVAAVDEFYTQDSIDAALRGSDYAVVALPLTKHTQGLINYERLGLMRRDGILVNIGRAPIIVKNDLIRFLRENPSFTYATDVWWNIQNPSQDSDVYSLPNVVSTPWVAGAASSRETYEEMLRLAVENVVRYLRGEKPLNIVRHEDYR
ncbi:MAG: 2-hydroxyacid dehydrogenase [Nitrososphaerota archaeon]|nr:2-hydroxyacid dehydrogenase [Candidatus Calditenuaceae archaeon]MDW8072625.1 2-hydroxyacid dehydrogenase [Nitrososphaerota archaeon]